LGDSDHGGNRKENEQLTHNIGVSIRKEATKMELGWRGGQGDAICINAFYHWGGPIVKKSEALTFGVPPYHQHNE
jgi:hypothetical protein